MWLFRPLDHEMKNVSLVSSAPDSGATMGFGLVSFGEVFGPLATSLLKCFFHSLTVLTEGHASNSDWSASFFWVFHGRSHLQVYLLIRCFVS